MTATKPDLGADGPAARARPTYDAIHRGKVIARAVAATPLEYYALAGQITERELQAGRRLEAALLGSWPQGRITTAGKYVSDPGLDDDEGEQLSEEEQHAARTRCYLEWKRAQRYVGTNWQTVQGVCRGDWATSYGGLAALRVGLRDLADAWGMERT